ncbi:MAG TPA: carboxypeptidase-like regulatory domain-containing protein [Candidatus Hydrogenedens sp.]|nr:carboxypeptidase-like regulatory domain-containing protein [Candidatus Hydrogenedens sp.]HOL20485.1 carboxypeptidase-like regulatory domain-containing protein [Candidatus Hydrogenedens sp.]HPP57907.1 carboxypeptidase-like regulatory domain-containing protein [Candidatus Hydrogenedens sp.]
MKIYIFFNIFCCLIFFNSFAGNCIVRGKVIDERGTPVLKAEVYCEQGLSEPLLQTWTDSEGKFAFLGLREGPSGFFATSEGKAWGGIHINLPTEEEISNVEIILSAPDKVTGFTVYTDEKGKEKGVPGVEVERFAILGSEKVAIPYSKLVKYGYKKIVSNTDGFFTIDKVPKEQAISIKVVHPDYAVATLESVTPGMEAKIQLSKGCVVLGSVWTIQLDKQVKVANADVIIKNTQPPFESVFVQTDNDGEFTIRLNTGVYLCKAETSRLSSTGWETKKISNPLGEYLKLQVCPSTWLYGTIGDAISGEPVAGARVVIEQGGRKSLVLTTGSKGKFQGKVTQGQALVKFETIPGYSMPQPSQIRVLVSDKEIELPCVWVKRLNSLKIKTVAVNGTVPENKTVIANLINPTQLGWYIGNTQNPLEINITTFPEKGNIFGYVEVPEDNEGNLFLIVDNDLSKVYEVPLGKLGKVKGILLSKQGKPISGLIFSCIFVDERTNQEYVLWQILSNEDGSVKWESVVPKKTIVFKIYGIDGTLLWESTPLHFEEGEAKDLGYIYIDKIQDENISNNIVFNPEKYVQICPEGKNPRDNNKGPALFVFAEEEEVLMIQEVLDNIRKLWGESVQYGIIVEKTVDCNGLNIPIYRGKQPSLATTYAIDNSGKVIYEVVGLPIIKKP